MHRHDLMDACPFEYHSEKAPSVQREAQGKASAAWRGGYGCGHEQGRGQRHRKKEKGNGTNPSFTTEGERPRCKRARHTNKQPKSSTQ